MSQLRYCQSCQHCENEYTGNNQMHQDIWIENRLALITAHTTGELCISWSLWSVQVCCKRWTASERLLILDLLILDEKFHLFFSKFLPKLLQWKLLQWKAVWGHLIVTLFRPSDADSTHPDLDAEHKQNWVWPWTIIQNLKLRLAQWWSPVSFTWDAWPSLAHLFLFITLF